MCEVSGAAVAILLVFFLVASSRPVESSGPAVAPSEETAHWARVMPGM